MTPGRLWWLIRRDYGRGWKAAWNEYFVGPRIWSWRNPYAGTAVQSTPVTVVLGAQHLVMTAWMLASWTSASGRNWRIVLHDDGTVPPDSVARLCALGLEVSMISRAVADAQMGPLLADAPRCRHYRKQHPLGLKIFDVLHLAADPRVLLLDPDVLFFRRPDEILRWVDEPGDNGCWFNADVEEASNVRPDEALDRLGVTLWAKVNSGLCLLPSTVVDLPFCERALEHTGLLSGRAWRVEQTLFALCASRHGRGGLLPSTYAVTLAPTMNPGTIARHYVGAVRARFWAEGIRQVHHRLIGR